MRVVIPSVNYGDFLAVTLPRWCELLPVKPIVVTSSDDVETLRVTSRNGCQFFATDAWTRGGSAFNKARALGQAFGFEKSIFPRPAIGEPCLSLDADVYPFGEIDLDVIRDDTLYAAPRYSCPDPKIFAAHLDGSLPREKLHQIKSWRGRRDRDPPGLQGYFQLWRYRGNDTFGSYPTAARYDVDFGRTFPRREYLPNLYVVHLGEHRRNWHGRVTPRWQPDEQERHEHAS